MQCLLCNKPTRCSCRGWGCPGCNSNNQTITFTNDLVKFWLDKKLIREKLKWIRTYVGKIDAYTMYEFLSETITEEEFNKAVEEYNSKQATIRTATSFEKVNNPSKMCYYDFPGTWARCKYCWKIAKYMQWKECPAFKEKQEEKQEETQGTTVPENK